MNDLPRATVRGSPAARFAPLLLSLVPLPAIGVGALIAERAGIPALAFAPNLAAWMLAALVIVIAPRCPATLRDRFAPVAALVATALVVRTLVDPGIEGVHRWLPLGPLRLHASMALAPWIAIAFARASHREDVVQVRLIASLVLTAQIVHLAQPDTQQACTLALGTAPLLLGDRASPRISRTVWGASLVLALLTWRRPDPLDPLPHVERILGLALTQGTLLFVLAAGSLMLVLAPLALLASEAGPRGRLALAGTLWLVTQIALTGLGAFPVPVIGAGAAGVLGAAGWLAALQASRRDTRRQPAANPAEEPG